MSNKPETNASGKRESAYKKYAKDYHGLKTKGIKRKKRQVLDGNSQDEKKNADKLLTDAKKGR
jgi:hypothetical protein